VVARSCAAGADAGRDRFEHRRLAGLRETRRASLPADRKIDGQELSALLAGGTKIGSAYDTFYFYHANQLKVVRRGAWKFHTSVELVDLVADMGDGSSAGPKGPSSRQGQRTISVLDLSTS